MKKFVKIIAILITLVMLMGVIASCESADSNQQATSGGEEAGGVEGGIAPLGNGKDIFKDPIKIAMVVFSTMGIVNRIYEMALAEQSLLYPNITVNIMDSQYDPNRQISLIEEAVAQGYDAIFLEPMDLAACVNAVAAAEDAGIIVVSMNVGSPPTPHTLHIAGNDLAVGIQGAEELDKLTRGIPNRTAIILDVPAILKPTARMGTGFEDWVKQNTDIEVLEVIGIDNFSADNAQIAMRDMLTKYAPGDITMVYCVSDDIAHGAINAIEQAGRTGDGIYIWGFMGYPHALEAIKAGKLSGTSFSDVYVQTSMMFYITLQNIALGLNSRSGGYTSTPVVQVPNFAVTAENVDAIMGASRWYS